MVNSDLKISKTHVRRVFDFTDEVVERYPNRLAGTKSCRNAANRIKEEFAKNCDADSVKIEDFTVHPKSFLKYIPGLVVLYFIGAILLYLAFPLPALIVYALAIFIFYAQFARYWELLDPLFPRATGYNVYGSIEPEGKVKQQVVVSAHHDAAYVFQLLAHVPQYCAWLVPAGVLVLLLGFLVALVATIMALFHVGLPPWVAVALMGLGIFQVPLAFFTTREVSPAAGDNMIAVAIASETARIFQDAKKSGKNPLRHTRIIIASFDAEEAGLRGARTFCKRHGEELLRTKTYVFNVDTLYKLEDLSFLVSDLNSTVKLSRAMVKDCIDTTKALGYTAKTAAMPFGAGSTDAAEFGKLGVEATNLAGISFNVSEFGEGLVYHTRNDLSKYIEPELVKASLEIIRDYILKKDSES